MSDALINLDTLCKAFAPVFEAMGQPAPTAQDVVDMVVKEEEERVARINAAMRGRGEGKNERRFLRDERGNAYGQVVAEIPEDLAFNLLNKRNKRFGPDAFNSAEGIAEIVKAYPECGVKNVDKKFIGVGIGAGPRRKRGVRFGAGTMKFAS